MRAARARSTIAWNRRQAGQAGKERLRDNGNNDRLRRDHATPAAHLVRGRRRPHQLDDQLPGELCESLDVLSGERVLDVTRTACGRRSNGATSAGCASCSAQAPDRSASNRASSSSGSPHPTTCSTTSSAGSPTNVAFAALDQPAQEALARDLLAVYSRHNRAGDAAMVAPSGYLEVIVIKA
jgi:hypothetical protein